MLKSYWVVVLGGCGLQDFSVSPRPLGCGFCGFLGLGLRGLTTVFLSAPDRNSKAPSVPCITRNCQMKVFGSNSSLKLKTCKKS